MSMVHNLAKSTLCQCRSLGGQGHSVPRATMLDLLECAIRPRAQRLVSCFENTFILGYCGVQLMIKDGWKRKGERGERIDYS